MYKIIISTMLRSYTSNKVDTIHSSYSFFVPTIQLLSSLETNWIIKDILDVKVNKASGISTEAS